MEEKVDYVENWLMKELLKEHKQKKSNITFTKEELYIFLLKFIKVIKTY